MDFSTWLLFVAAVTVLTVTPGPSVFMCVANAVQLGPRRAAVGALGSTTAIVGIMVLSALGLGAVLAASDVLFNALKWLGAAYLAYLGMAALLSKSTDFAGLNDPGSAPGNGTVTVQQSAGGVFIRGLLVGASNPKALLFFAALFPQFVDPGAPQLPQFLILGTTFVCFELFWLAAYIAFAGKARHWLRAAGRARAFNRCTGVVFLLTAGLLVMSKRSPP